MESSKYLRVIGNHLRRTPHFPHTHLSKHSAIPFLVDRRIDKFFPSLPLTP